MTPHILVPDNVDAAAIKKLEQHNSITITAPGKMSREETMRAIPQADALIIRSATKADADLLRAANKLKVIARAGVGVDNVDLDVATERGIVVMNTPAGNTISTAEHAFGLMLALARHIPQGHQSMTEGRWDRKLFMGTELRGKTLGIIGFGRIGRALAKRAIAFEMDILTHDPYIPHDVAEDLGARLVDLDALYALSDFISLHSLITDETREMINHDSIAKMKRGVRIINAARGALINESDLAEAIQEGRVAGAAVDVYSTEPPGDDHPLVGLPGVIHTPHLAASTTEAQVAVAVEAAELVLDALLNETYNNVVNPAVLNR
ncbi:MAG: phosphoglycerate dehydrogenase [Chloroflexi bacterium]|nr:MAG: phosphoglycerate dehydrogenase [Chloroflexota bacterium]